MHPFPKPSATVVVVRDASQGFEVLLLERNTGKNVWVFPGGKVDEEDGPTHWLEGWEEAGRQAAVREAREEAGIHLDAASMVTLSRWVTPEVAPKRFDTLFFLAWLPADAPVQVDGGEIASHRWFSPRLALSAHHADEIRLLPPTFVTVSWLVDHVSVSGASAAFAAEPTPVFRPQICQRDEGVCMLYPGDAGYEARDPGVPGPRHRCVMGPSGLRYERDQPV
ncbi:MAG: NUDIX hydrolase [Deltaproteobacteria bacterium]|nr:NUDIX hydrolase [Deltaproteobacteria bacterium]MBW2359448.1 NUDIX hydrolase [Deltaproteobacteria bacterium]